MQRVPLAEFIVSAGSASDFPDSGLPEVVFAGRSNVGKSSLINNLTKSKGLARISSTPGKTQCINFYRIDRACYFVDLPGFGYAKTGKAISRQWKQLIEQYFNDRSTIVLVLQLVDARIAPTELDRKLADWLDHLRVKRRIVATKVDKLSGNQVTQQRREISGAFGEIPVILCSATSGTGCPEIWNHIIEAIQAG
jgi:GTP-binding protein